MVPAWLMLSIVFSVRYLVMSFGAGLSMFDYMYRLRCEQIILCERSPSFRWSVRDTLATDIGLESVCILFNVSINLRYLMYLILALLVPFSPY